MNNPYATPDQIERVRNIEKYMENNPVSLGSEDHNAWVYWKNTLNNLINTFYGYAHNNPVGGRQHSFSLYNQVIASFKKLEMIR